MDPNTITILIAIAGCFVGLAGWLSKRDDKIEGDSQWKGEVSEKLNTISRDTSDIPKMKESIHRLEESNKSAHKRIDDILSDFEKWTSQQ